MPDTTLLSETILFAGLGDDALAKVVEAWDRLPASIKSMIVSLVEEAEE